MKTTLQRVDAKTLDIKAVTSLAEFVSARDSVEVRSYTSTGNRVRRRDTAPVAAVWIGTPIFGVQHVTLHNGIVTQTRYVYRHRDWTPSVLDFLTPTLLKAVKSYDGEDMLRRFLSLQLGIAVPADIRSSQYLMAWLDKLEDAVVVSGLKFRYTVEQRQKVQSREPVEIAERCYPVRVRLATGTSFIRVTGHENWEIGPIVVEVPESIVAEGRDAILNRIHEALFDAQSERAWDFVHDDRDTYDESVDDVVFENPDAVEAVIHDYESRRIT